MNLTFKNVMLMMIMCIQLLSEVCFLKHHKKKQVHDEIPYKSYVILNVSHF